VPRRGHWTTERLLLTQSARAAMAGAVGDVFKVLEQCGAPDLDLAEFIVDLARSCDTAVKLGQQLEEMGAAFEPGQVVAL
jgi:hypothetical protein